jgi:DNA-binding beta-propeller fold protein YncE
MDRFNRKKVGETPAASGGGVTMGLRRIGVGWLLLCVATQLQAGYMNFEASHVHPIDLTPAGDRLLAVNTPDAMLEVFFVQPGGTLAHQRSIPVGLEPVTVVARTETEAWVVNNLSDSISIVDLDLGVIVRTLSAGDEPTDVVFANGRAFATASQEDAVRVFDLADLDAAPASVSLFSRKPRALAVSTDGSRVYAVALLSGNQTSVVNANEIWGTGNGFNLTRLAQLGLNPIECDAPPPLYPPLPPGIGRNPDLTDPQVEPGDPDNRANFPPVGLIVRWNDSASRWEDETGQDWSGCLPIRLPDHDLFVIDTTSLAVSEVDHLGTSLFDVSVNPGDGRIWVPHTAARNFVRFEHPLGVQGHMVDNRLAIVDPSDSFSVEVIDLNAHIDRGSDPSANLAERMASLSQPGMMVWNQSGTQAYLTAIGSRKVFRLDAACSAGSCIFGPNRASPTAVEVGEGPTGVALLESENRLFVLNRFSNSLAVVDATGMVKLSELRLHDPSPDTVKAGRRFLYDAIDGSGHGDAACSSCHLFGDRDDLAWDLGNPEGDYAPYSKANDNVRFILPLNGLPNDCDPAVCASHDGFDPQKGPMTTQTLRGMLEPLHWRGDRATMNNFNQAFPGLMGTQDIGPIANEPAGLSAAEMELFRQFSLAIALPPNPHRNWDDSLPCGRRGDDPTCEVQVHGSPFSGNPTEGAHLFDNGNTDAGQPCKACHTHPFGAAGGQLGGVTPREPTSSGAAALFNGDADQSPHSDLKVAHLRNMYEKIGPTFGDHVAPPPLARSGFGFTHDGSVPDLGTFFSHSVFTVTAQEARDLSLFSMHFPTGTKPAVGLQFTVPPGPPPNPALSEAETVLAGLIGAWPGDPGLGDLANGARHCELVVATLFSGTLRRYYLSAGLWIPDAADEPPLTTTELREGASSPLSFLCAPDDSGLRLGSDRDEDGRLNADDCAEADPQSWSPPVEVSGLQVASIDGAAALDWDDQALTTGPSLRYEVLGGGLPALNDFGLAVATACLAADLDQPEYDDARDDPATGDGYYYLIRGTNPCARGSAGPGRESLDGLGCP